MVQNLRHEHLATFVGGWEQLGRCHLMWEWADGGNLESFWSAPDIDSRSTTAIQWAMKQMLGLAEALQQIHQFDQLSPSVHGDLRPGGILVFVGPPFQPSPVLKISDIGLGGPAKAGTLRPNSPYRSPCFILDSSHTLSPSDDMWSMGCILFEFIIWLLYGPGSLSEFREEQQRHEVQDDVSMGRFCRVVSGKSKPSYGVTVWNQSMRHNDLEPPGKSSVSPALRKLLSYLFNQLMGHFHDSKAEAVPSHQQPAVNASRLCKELRAILSEGKGEPAHFFNADQTGGSSNQLLQERASPHVNVSFRSTPKITETSNTALLFTYGTGLGHNCRKL